MQRLEEKSYFKEAIRLFATNDDVKAFNEENLKELRQKISLIQGSYNCLKAQSAAPILVSGLEASIYLSVGCKVKLRMNHWTEKGLVHGALGYVENIIYKETHKPPEQIPKVIMVPFDNFTRPTFNVSGCAFLYHQ